ncbi:MaoC family dehydratase [Brevibacillus laterosporus]|uniref:MaoC family dehydratase n=1 Tax=Brevibacillus laterosporus TaxID=1465 RepID=UPI00264BBC85|nr:MaoC family dehydratase [Brevibacillus laterosporus]MDN9009515.1 MaoC family dehydratase [Brevibacillus laterosporus]MDO0940486.1 MaoC family dehydratase [Brevibacillus laterosporus]
MSFKIGQSASFSRTMTETDFVMFAGLSGDYNPIHVDKEYAGDTRFGQRISHGLLTASLLSRLLGMHLPGKGSVYKDQTLQFKAPVFIGDTITATATVKEFNEARRMLTLVTECTNQHGIVVLTGIAIMVVPKEGEKI